MDRTRTNQFRVVRVAPKVQNLHRDAPAHGMHCISDDPVLVGFVRRRQLCATWVRPRFVVRCDSARHDEGHAATCACRVERCHSVEAVFGFLKSNVHRTHEDPVRQRHETEV